LTIDDDFFIKLKPMGKHNSHIVWMPGKEGEAYRDSFVRKAYSNIEREMIQLGVHGTYVAVDWDDCIGRRSCFWVCSKNKTIDSSCRICQNKSCVTEGSCITICPTEVFQWSRDRSNSNKNNIPLFMDKSDPVRESECIFCMACVTACPTQAINVEEAGLDIHDKNFKY